MLLVGWFVCGMAFGVPPSVTAQTPAGPVILPNTEQRLLRSSGDDIGYKLYVSIPKGYGESGRTYPTIYLLDADYSFAIARNIVEHLSDRGDLSQAIIVGIAYDGPDAYRMNRTRDYTPTYSPTGGYGPTYQAASGGGPAFRRFIAADLIPFVEREYRASRRRVLVGHSYGGLFATWVAFTMPDLFGGYVIVSPSLWYDDKMIFDVEERTAAARDDLPVRMYLTVGSREVNSQRNMVTDLQRLIATLESRRYPQLKLDWSVADDETHNSVFPRALSDGLRFVLEGR